MATISYTTTAAQDAALLAVLQRVNADRAAQAPPLPAFTAKQYLDYLMAQWLDSIVTQAGTHEEGTVREAWAKADATTRAQVKTVLGL